MADFFKGLAGGFGTGLQFGQAMRDREERERQMQMRDDLAQEANRYSVTEGAYGPGLQENIQQLQVLRERDPAQAAAYDQAIGELTRRQGLTAPDYSVASGPTNFATRQEARQAAAPMRAEGLAGVYRQYGDVTKADELEARAFDQQRAIAAEQRAQTAEGRAAQDFATRQTETGLRINQLARTEAEQQNFTGFNTFAAENPNLSVKELKDAAFKQFKFTPKQWQDTVATRLQIETGEMDSFKNSVKKKLQGKNLNQLGELYNSDPDFDDKTDLAIVPGKGGAVTLNFIDKATGRVTTSETFKSQALATEYLNKQATEPETIGSWMMNLQKAEVGLDKDRAATRASDATVGLRGAQAKQIRESADNANARADLIEKFEALTDEEKAGAKGQGLIKQFNLLNVKAGGTVPLGAAPRAATGPARELSDLDKENLRYYRDWAKDPKNAKLPQGQKDAFAAELGVTEFIKRGAAGPESGLGANVYAAPQQGVDTTRAPAATLRPTPMRGPSDLSSVDIQKIRSDAATLDAAIAQVQAQASAVVRSGDTNAIKLYGDRLNALRAQRQALTAGLTGPAIQSVGLQ